MLPAGFPGSAAMAGAPAGLPHGIRLSDHISLGVIAQAFPPDRVRQILAETGKASERERDLPAHVMVYYAIALALYTGSGTREVLRCLLEGLRWLWGAGAVRVAGKRAASRRPARAWARRRCADYTSRWCIPWRRAPPWGRGTGRGVWSAWTGPASTWPTPRRTGPRSGAPGPAAARAPSRSSASWLGVSGDRAREGSASMELKGGEDRRSGIARP